MSVRSRISKSYSSMTSSQKEIADCLTANLDLVAYGTVKEVAERVGKSEATVVRFAYLLGYSGYKELQSDVQEQMQQEFSIAQRYRKAESQGAGTVRDTLMETALLNLRQTYTLTPEADLLETARLLAGARRVGIVSYRLASSAAVLMEVLLQQVLDDVRLLSPNIGNTFDILRGWDEQDVVFGFAFHLSQEGSYVYNAVQYAKERHCRVVLITNTSNSDTASFSDLVLTVSSEGKVLSLVSCVHLIEVLSQMVYECKRDVVAQNLEEVEVTFRRFGLSRKSDPPKYEEEP